MLILYSGDLRGSQFRSRDGSPVRNHDQHWFIFLLRSTGIVVVVMSLLAVLFTNLVLEPIHETGMTPLKLFTTQVWPTPLIIETDTINWSIIPVSKVFVLQMRLFGTVTACRWQIFFDRLNEGPELQDAIQVKALWDDELGTSLAFH